ncbi:MAG: M14 family zinc carboxypeptidase [Candidatus Bathyarchaeia archaeon]
MKKFLLSIFLAILALLILTAECAPYDLSPFHSKKEKITMWKTLWAAHPNTEYKSVGKTYSGQDIWLFSVGNPAGGRVLWDAEMHGGEDKGSEILYLIAKWLLESGDQRAAKILEENHVLFIPVINDRNERGNGNVELSPHGVDLNRNFETGWRYVKPGDGEWCYAGAYPVSEPETKTLRNVFLNYKPIFYVNMHCGAGPYAAYYNGGNKTLSEQVILKTKKVCDEMSVVPYPTHVLGSRGYAIGDAVALGVQSAWLIECVGAETAGLHSPEHYEELVTVFFPKCQAMFIAMCEISALIQGSSMMIEKAPKIPSIPAINTLISPQNTINQIANYTKHDLAIISMGISFLQNITQDKVVNVNITVLNDGTQTETFNLTLYVNSTSIAKHQITLTSNNKICIIISWNTTNFAEGTYTISAHIQPVTNETNVANNTFELTGYQIINPKETMLQTPDELLLNEIAASALLLSTLLLIAFALRLKKSKVKQQSK